MWRHVSGWQMAARRALETLMTTDALPRVARLVAPPGFGKTHVVEEMRARSDGHRIIRLCARSSYRGVRVLEELRRLLGMGSLGGTVEGRIAVVAAALRQRGVRVIVIDDAGYISRGLTSAVALLPALCAAAQCSAVLCAAFPTEALLPCGELDAELAIDHREMLVPGYACRVGEPGMTAAGLRAALEALAGCLALCGAMGRWPLPEAATEALAELLARPDAELPACTRGALTVMAGELAAAGMPRTELHEVWAMLGFGGEQWQWLAAEHFRTRFG